MPSSSSFSSSSSSPEEPSIKEERLGVLDGVAINSYQLSAAGGAITARVLNYGAAVASICMPNKRREYHDIVLGFDSAEEYARHSDMSLCGVLGRVCGVVSRARFGLGDDIYYLSENRDSHHHWDGAEGGFHKAVWNARIKDDMLILTHVSTEGEAGYPGSLLAKVTYQLFDGPPVNLEVHMEAVCDQPTPVDMSLVMPINLAGHDAGVKELKNHIVTMNADYYATTTAGHLPTGRLRCVGGTWYDFRRPLKMGYVLNRPAGGGYDHNFLISNLPLPDDRDLKLIARVEHPEGGRAIEIRSDQPGVRLSTCRDLPSPPPPTQEELLDAARQINEADFYGRTRPLMKELFPSYVDIDAIRRQVLPLVEELIPNIEELPEPEPPPPECVDSTIDGEGMGEGEGDEGIAGDDLLAEEEEEESFTSLKGKDGALYCQNGAIIIAPQGLPNAVNRKKFSSCILMPGEVYSKTVVYNFFSGAEKKCMCGRNF